MVDSNSHWQSSRGLIQAKSVLSTEHSAPSIGVSASFILDRDRDRRQIVGTSRLNVRRPEKRNIVASQATSDFNPRCVFDRGDKRSGRNRGILLDVIGNDYSGKGRNDFGAL